MTVVVDFNDQGPEHWLKKASDDRRKAQLEQRLKEMLDKRILFKNLKGKDADSDDGDEDSNVEQSDKS